MTQVTLPQPIHSGKVRDTYELPDEPDRLLIVTTNRISTFDEVHLTPIPGKGKLLTHMTEYWMTQSSVAQIVPNHFITTDLSGYPEWVRQFQGRGMVVKRLEMIPIEAIVRGYITGSAWKQYRKDGTMNGVEMPKGMIEAQSLSEPTFTPSTKAVEGHDENISIEQMVERVGQEIATTIERLSIALYIKAHREARDKGILIADTKFEFGIDPITGVVTLGDEILTPDSSRFWSEEEWRTHPGKTPPSLDKQFVRDYVAGLKQEGESLPDTVPDLPLDVVTGTQARYREVCKILTGEDPIVFDLAQSTPVTA